MKNTFVNITGKLPSGLTELYIDIQQHTNELGIEYLVIGAMARDLVLFHGFGANIERGTRDVDFGINVANWHEFSSLRDRLLEAGYKADERRIHRLTCEDKEGLPWEIDIVPFGDIADEDSRVHWPPEQNFAMSVFGFAEAFEHALKVQISESPEIVIPVASPASICMLKLVSWLDREIEMRPKDATDFSYLIESYRKIPEISEALYNEGHMETQAWDESKASAMKLGEDTARIASGETKAFIENELFNQPARLEQFARDMHSEERQDLAANAELLSIFVGAFLNRQPSAS